MMKLKTTLKALKKYHRFLISTHVNPDPDALCSELAVAEYLKSIGKEVMILNEEAVPSRFHFLPGVKQMKSLDNAPKTLKYDVVLVVDCGDFSRIGRVCDVLDKTKPVFNIDHHITNDQFGQYNLVEPKASSTAELLFELLEKAKVKLTKSLAVNLYTGIMTDTGSFRYENTTARTHEIISRLMQFDIQPDKLYRTLYESIPLKDIEAFTQVINNFSSVANGKIACLHLKKSLVAKFSEDFDLRDAIFKFLRSVQGIEVIVILTEVSRKETRLNFRSTNKVNVAKIARYFNGGGHRKASGGRLDVGLKKANDIVIAKIKKEL
ncbi:MAG: bifunctional oligoribonuclease/PAP phosphatase NrnA [Candidatus Omnitrophica bacterium]|nr:bifunctional oligoribonuclease/PAP phosphatase NrnA [Candidatus Omnitrophota bacterium]